MNSYAVDRAKWAQLSIFEQMGNIFSEVGRTFNARRSGDVVAAQSSMIRAVDLFDASTEHLIAHKSVQAREVLRAKDQFLQVYFADQHNDAAARSLEKYFMNFAVAARLHR